MIMILDCSNVFATIVNSWAGSVNLSNAIHWTFRPSFIMHKFIKPYNDAINNYVVHVWGDIAYVK